MSKGLKWYYKAAVTQPAAPNVKVALDKNRTTQLFRLRKVFFYKGPLRSVRRAMMPSAEEQTLYPGRKKCKGKKRNVSRPVEFFLRHAHFYQITPALAEVSKLQAVSPLRVFTHSLSHNTHTGTHTLRALQKGDALEPRQKP